MALPNPSTTGRAHRVRVMTAAIRTAPGGGGQLACLPFGAMVSLMDTVGFGPLSHWVRVLAPVNGTFCEGFIERMAVEAMTLRPVGLPEPHLDNSPGTVKRKGTSRAYRLNEEPMPRRKAGSTNAAVFDKLIQWFDVEKSARYQPGGGKTYCNIYAYDFVHLAGAFIPRVWWQTKAIADLRAGKTVVPVYEKTVTELNANSLYDWLGAYGGEFRWRKLADADEAQTAANRGKLVVMCGKKSRDPETKKSRSGHISIVVPETATEKAKRNTSGKVMEPLQSQAGRNNHKYYTANWGTGSSWLGRGFWAHD